MIILLKGIETTNHRKSNSFTETGNTATASALSIVTLMNRYQSLLEQHIRETIFSNGFRIQK